MWCMVLPRGGEPEIVQRQLYNDRKDAYESVVEDLLLHHILIYDRLTVSLLPLTPTCTQRLHRATTSGIRCR